MNDYERVFVEDIPTHTCTVSECGQRATTAVAQNISRNDCTKTTLEYYCTEHWPEDDFEATEKKLIPDDLDAPYVRGPAFVAESKATPSTIESELHTMSVGQFMDRLIALFPSVNDRYLTPLFMEVLDGGDKRVTIEAGPVVNVTRDPEQGEVSCIIAGFSSHDEWELAHPSALWRTDSKDGWIWEIKHRHIGTYMTVNTEAKANTLVTLFNAIQFNAIQFNPAQFMNKKQEGHS